MSTIPNALDISLESHAYGQALISIIGIGLIWVVVGPLNAFTECIVAIMMISLGSSIESPKCTGLSDIILFSINLVLTILIVLAFYVIIRSCLLPCTAYLQRQLTRATTQQHNAL